MRSTHALFYATLLAYTASLAAQAPQVAQPAEPTQTSKPVQPAQPQTPGPNSQYRLGPDSMPQDGVPKGQIRGPFTLPSKVYPGTQHTYWVYVPAQYDPAVPTSLMVYNDGQAFMNPRETCGCQT
jgi:hypothetical protein